MNNISKSRAERPSVVDDTLAIPAGYRFGPIYDRRGGVTVRLTRAPHPVPGSAPSTADLTVFVSPGPAIALMDAISVQEAACAGRVIDFVVHRYGDATMVEGWLMGLGAAIGGAV